MNIENQINDGGPAFPMAGNTSNWDAEKGQYVPQHGMALRDWFAGQALAGLVANIGPKFWVGDAENVYEIADAMIAARNNTKPCATP